ncbi:Dimethylaniline monooxygenase [N-oxide-forming] 2 [Lamellibrachia satsuma]|nr:Dimethylaniline monooxygenase [N-oxide-forming] 2 [Lamellibrachia satsuma]
MVHCKSNFTVIKYRWSTMPDVKTVAIVGAGAGGLTAIKCCIDEGLSPTCFERSSELGGLWYYTVDPLVEGRVCVAPTTTSNLSKEMSAFSDFPFPKQFSNFMHHSHMLTYLRSYAAKFDLEKYIKYDRDVTLVEPAADYDSTGRWTVAAKDRKSGEVKSSTFDAVLVCNGLNNQPRWPEIPGLKSFNGRVLHAVEHGDLTVYDGKRVVVIGMGNSGSDVAVDASRTASKVFLVTRKGEWFTNRFNDVGLPFDTDLFRRANGGLFRKVPRPQFDHAIYRVIPTWSYVDRRHVVSSELQSQILCGYVAVKAEAVSVKDTSVQFSDGSREEEIAVIVCATGYNYSFPPLKGHIQLQGSGKGAFLLYRWMFPPSLKHPTLALVGLSPEITPAFPKVEMQSRWATRVFKGRCHLPDSKKMWREIHGRRNDVVDYLTYMDALAADVGCKPSIVKLLLTDPKLGWRCYFGPLAAYQYRLTGPDKWSGARDAILGIRERMLYPLNTRPIPQELGVSGHHTFTLLVTVAPFLAAAAYGLLWWRNNY